MNVYEQVEEQVRREVLARARGRARSPEFVARCVRLAIWLARKHGPYGRRIFALCRIALAKVLGWRDCWVRSCIGMLRTIGFAVFLPRPDGRLRKWGSPEFAAYQFQMGDAFAAFFAEPSEGQSRQKKKGSVLACFSGGIAPARSWNRAAPEFRLPLSDTRQGVRKAALASLDALKGLPMPKLSDAARGLMQRR